MNTYAKYFKLFMVFSLLIYPSIAVSGEWIKDTTKKCDVWIDEMEPNISVTWSGVCVNGKISGNGILQLYKDGKKDARIEVQFINGKASGKGTCTWADGSEYIGDFANGNFSGKGTYKSKDMECAGEFRNGKLNGKGFKKWTDGNKYEGDFVNDEMHGKGTYTWPNGTKYVGDFVNNKIEGKGVKIFADGGDREEGIWKDDELVKSKDDAEQDEKKSIADAAAEMKAKEKFDDLKKNWKTYINTFNLMFVAGDKYINQLISMCYEPDETSPFAALYLSLAFEDMATCAARNKNKIIYDNMKKRAYLFSGLSKERAMYANGKRKEDLIKILSGVINYYPTSKDRPKCKVK